MFVGIFLASVGVVLFELSNRSNKQWVIMAVSR